MSTVETIATVVIEFIVPVSISLWILSRFVIKPLWLKMGGSPTPLKNTRFGDTKEE